LPLLRGDANLRGTGLLLLALIPVTSLLLYQGVGTPDAMGPSTVHPGAAVEDGSAGEMGRLLVELEARLNSQPDDLQGWLLLGRSYKSVQRYPDALRALQHARRLAPEDPLVAAELAEAMLFTSGPGPINPEIREMLEVALEADPRLQKGLWLLGIIESQAGNDEAALAYWERLIPLLEPGSGVHDAVQQQIVETSERLGRTAPQTQPQTQAWEGIEITVTADLELESLPSTAVLFVIARDPASPVPPLGAVRIPNPGFPMTVKLTDANSMLPQRPISGQPEIQLLARLSMSGTPAAAAGDPQSEPTLLTTGDSSSVSLELVLPQP
jgi:cytochrome c-type biogenesis protein CcmH